MSYLVVNDFQCFLGDALDVFRRSDLLEAIYQIVTTLTLPEEDNLLEDVDDLFEIVVA